MDEFDARLKNIEKQVAETRKMVGELRGAQRRASFWRFIKFAVWVAVAWWAVTKITPYIAQISELYESMRGILP